MNNLELIGKGAFSKVYKVNSKTVLFKTTCMVKYCFAEWLGGGKFYPEIWKDEGNNLIGRMYTKVTAPKRQLKPLHYKFYRALRELSDSAVDESYSGLYEAFEGLKYGPLRESLINALDGICNYVNCDDIRFEISPRNIMTDSKGNIILNDVFFCSKLLRNLRR